MRRPKQGTHNAGLRQVTLLDHRGRVLAYADTLAVRGHTVGLTRASFSPTGIVRLAIGRERVTVTVRGRSVLVLTRVRFHVHTGERRARDGTWTCEAAIGTVGSILRRGV